MSKAITGLTGGSPATFQQYRHLFDRLMRPAKFSNVESGFMLTAGRGMPRCEGCIHWYVNPKTRHSVCEVVRLPNEINIRATSTCKFQTGDGYHFPLLETL